MGKTHVYVNIEWITNLSTIQYEALLVYKRKKESISYSSVVLRRNRTTNGLGSADDDGMKSLKYRNNVIEYTNVNGIKNPVWKSGVHCKHIFYKQPSCY